VHNSKTDGTIEIIILNVDHSFNLINKILTKRKLENLKGKLKNLGKTKCFLRWHFCMKYA